VSDTAPYRLHEEYPTAEAFALGSVLTRRIDDGLPIGTMEAWSMLLGAVVMHAVSAGLSESVADVRWTPTAVLAPSYLVVVASALAGQSGSGSS
jgi:hypothetical protein